MRKAITLTSLVFFASADVRKSGCNSWCFKSENGDGGYTSGGSVIGTAPTCTADCDEDCGEGRCTYVDGGGGCWTGEKVCCCRGQSGKKKEEITSEYEYRNDLAEKAIALKAEQAA